ncbi:MAG: tripeptide aminopeptidase PepT, partial [Anaerolineales bacterium]|nr:tripeptide aminopeptidase PepT [Anaerolineales bacterium]
MNNLRSLDNDNLASPQNLMNHFAAELEERFIRYVQVETTSDENSPSSPSTAKQFDLLRLLANELRALGASEIELTETGCVYATVPATAGYEDKPVVAFCAHVDTSPAFSGKGVKPLVHRNYDGSPLVLPDDPSQVIDPAEFSYLGEKVGDDIVTASGTTLLGADDKAGVAIMMVLANHLLNESEVAHGKVRLLFTPDEEIGRGVVNVDLQKLAADVGYTLDGSNLGEVTYESFSADKAVIKITGVSSHPGYSKGV